MSLSVQRLVVESFKFNYKNIRVVHIKNVDQLFVGTNVSKATGYNDDGNARRAIRAHVPGRYRMRLGDTQNILRMEVDIDFLREDIALLKNHAFIAISYVVKSLGPNLSWSGLWKQFYHGRFEN